MPRRIELSRNRLGKTGIGEQRLLKGNSGYELNEYGFSGLQWCLLFLFAILGFLSFQSDRLWAQFDGCSSQYPVSPCTTAPPGVDTTCQCLITQNTTFRPGVYRCSTYVSLISEWYLYICADNITVDGGGATFENVHIVVHKRKGVSIKNFVFQYNGYIEVDSSSDLRIENNRFLQPGAAAISLGFECHDNSIRINRINGGTITLGENANRNVVDSNTVLGNIAIISGRGNVISNDTVRKLGPSISERGTFGIILYQNADSNTIINNEVSGQRTDINVQGDSNQVLFNDVEGDRDSLVAILGVSVCGHENLIAHNLIHDCGFAGIGLLCTSGSPENNLVTLNDVASNRVGLEERTGSVENNRIYFNNFISNYSSEGTAVDAGHYWDADSVCAGNYWSDFDTPAEGCTDADSDGICDSPRVANGGAPIDRYPFVNMGGWANGLLSLRTSCIPQGHLRLLPIQSVLNTQTGNTFNLVAGKDLVIRTFYNLGPAAAPDIAVAKLCLDGGINSCPNGVIQIQDTVYPLGYPLTFGQRHEGKNSLNFVLRKDSANSLLTEGLHNFHVRIEPMKPGAFPVMEDSFPAQFRRSRQLIIHTVPVKVLGVLPDTQLIKHATDFLAAVYPIDEEAVFNRLQTPIKLDALPNTPEISGSLVDSLKRRRDAAVLYERGNFFAGRSDRILVAGVVGHNINGNTNPLGEGRGGFTPLWRRGISVVLDWGGPSYNERIIGPTLAHEVGHIFGFGDEYADGTNHSLNPPHGKGVDRYGDNGGWFILEPELAFDVGGFRDTLAQRPLPVFGLFLEAIVDFAGDIAVGYMGSSEGDQHSWTRQVNYRYLYDSLTQASTFFQYASSFTPTRPVVAITGWLGRNDSAHFDPLIIGNTDITLEPLPQGNLYRLEFRDSSGSILQGFNFDPDYSVETFTADSAFYDSSANTVAFDFLTELPTGCSSIVLLKAGVPLKSLTRSTHAPTVSITSIKPISNGLEVKWSGVDPDGDSLTYLVLYSSDSTNRYVVGVDVRDTVFDIIFNSSVLPPQSAVRITQASVTVQASDGFNYASVIAPVFSLKGDLNLDGNLSPADVVLELNCVFLATGNCSLGVADVNCDGNLTPADVVLELNAVFLGSPFPC